MAKANFHRDCVRKAEGATGTSFNRRTTSTYESKDGVRLVCLVSAQLDKSLSPSYWFAFKTEQETWLDGAVREGWVVLGCGSGDNTFLVPWSDFRLWLPAMSKGEGRDYWHVKVVDTEGRFLLRGLAGQLAEALDSRRI